MSDEATAQTPASSSMITDAEISSLLAQSRSVIDGIDLSAAEKLAKRAGLSTESSFFRREITTGGHNNTDHFIVWTGDEVTDKIFEMSRRLRLRMAKQLPERKLDDRWDKPKQTGERRRRIVREKDSPEAPAPPPKSAYAVFLALKSVKIRHDRPNERYHQTKAVQEISRIWRDQISEAEKQYYEDMSDLLQKEFEWQSLEFRATGTFTPSTVFDKLGENTSVWVHKDTREQNALEREVSGYETVDFPVRPPQFDAEYEKRIEESKIRRKEKVAAARKARNEARAKGGLDMEEDSSVEEVDTNKRPTKRRKKQPPRAAVLQEPNYKLDEDEDTSESSGGDDNAQDSSENAQFDVANVEQSAEV